MSLSHRCKLVSLFASRGQLLLGLCRRIVLCPRHDLPVEHGDRVVLELAAIELITVEKVIRADLNYRGYLLF